MWVYFEETLHRNELSMPKWAWWGYPCHEELNLAVFIVIAKELSDSIIELPYQTCCLDNLKYFLISDIERKHQKGMICFCVWFFHLLFHQKWDFMGWTWPQFFRVGDIIDWKRGDESLSRYDDSIDCGDRDGGEEDGTGIKHRETHIQIVK